MTGRERLLAALRGDPVDRPPVLCWSASPGHVADAIVAPLSMVRKAIDTHPDQAVLVEVVSPLGRALRRDIDLSETLDADPELGARWFDGLRQETLDEIESALSQGADGVFYVVDGAYAAATTPMQYGGYYLEGDRDLLRSARKGAVTVAYVQGEEDVYLDFVADLPADALAWDYEHLGLGIAAVRQLRTGAIAAPVPGADAVLLLSAAAVERWLSSGPPNAHPHAS